MCGLLGLITNSAYGGFTKDIDIFEEVLYYDAMRGWDSTGVALMQNDGGLNLLKEVGCAANFICNDEWGDMKKDYVKKGKAILGHNRKSTVGATNDATAHPFIIEDRYAFIHNGTLYNHKNLADTEVDSEALGIVLTKCNGNIEQLSETLHRVFGAYACAWIDRFEQKLYMLRNKDRPLYLAKTTNGFMFCSEPGFMRLASIRNGEKMDDVELIPENTLVTFDLSVNPVTMTSEVIPKKSTPAMVVTQSKAGLKTNTGVSKNEFKKMNKKGALVGRELSFYIEDYVEREPDKINSPGKKDWKLWGVSDNVKFPHKVHAYIKDLEDWELLTLLGEHDPIVTGVVASMDYDTKEKCVNIYVGIANVESPIPLH